MAGDMKTRDATASIIRTIAGGLLDLVYPRHCADCGVSLHQTSDLFLCASCWSLIPDVPEDACPRCARRGRFSRADSCPFCEKRSFGFDAAVAAAAYDGPGGVLVHVLKAERRSRAAEPMAERLCRTVEAQGAFQPQLVVPVPLHRTRRSERGFNQSELIAQRMARRLDVGISKGNLVRIRRTPDQKRLSVTQREENVKGAFAVRRPAEFAGKEIVVVDDVMTSGATLSECARMLKRAGAARVLAAAFARA